MTETAEMIDPMTGEIIDQKELAVALLELAEQSGARARTVGYHLSVTRRVQPGLLAEHDAAAAGRKQGRVTGRGLHRMTQLIARVQESGQYPFTKSADLDERALAAWLNRRSGGPCRKTRTSLDSGSYMTG